MICSFETILSLDVEVLEFTLRQRDICLVHSILKQELLCLVHGPSVAVINKDPQCADLS